ncbi:MAG: site-specific integrase [Nitrososphaera sp.]
MGGLGAVLYAAGAAARLVTRLDPALLFHGKRQPAEIGAVEVEAFLTQLAVQGQVASSTQNQALNAIVFLYRQVLEKGNSASWNMGEVRGKFWVIVKTA